MSCVHVYTKICILYKNIVYFDLEFRVDFFYQKCVFFKYCFILQTWTKIQRNTSICRHTGGTWLLVLHTSWVMTPETPRTAQLCLQIWKQNWTSLDLGHTDPATCCLYCICLSLLLSVFRILLVEKLYLLYHF